MRQIQESLDRLAQARVYSALEATSGFWQNPVTEQDIPKTAFVTRYGSYEFMVTPFGLKNSPSAFQRMMNEIFKDYLDDFILVYMDDIPVFPRSTEDHIKHLQLVSERLKEFNIQINMKKSVFCASSVKYEGRKFVVHSDNSTVVKLANAKDPHRETYYLMDTRGQRIDNVVAQDNLAPWLEPLTSNQNYFYDPTPREDAEPTVLTKKACEGKTDAYFAKKRKTGIPIRVPSND